MNGHQIGMVNALRRRQTFHALADDPLLMELPGLFAAFPDLYQARLLIEPHFQGDRDGTWVGGDLLRHAIQTSQITREIVFYDFGNQALKPVERAGLCHCPCLAVDGRVVAMSMPHPPVAESDAFPPQAGHKPGSWGKPLPGWFFECVPDSGFLTAHGPAAPSRGLRLPDAATLDAVGFLCRVSSRQARPAC